MPGARKWSDIHDADRTRRPSTSRTDVNAARQEGLIVENRPVTVRWSNIWEVPDFTIIRQWKWLFVKRWECKSPDETHASAWSTIMFTHSNTSKEWRIMTSHLTLVTYATLLNIPRIYQVIIVLFAIGKPTISRMTSPGQTYINSVHTGDFFFGILKT